MDVIGAPGQVIEDRYTLVEHIGSGAHGDVWIAKDRILGQSVAFTWMRFVHGKMQARIRREITTLRTLRFPGVVRLVDEGIAEGKPFLTMSLIDGRPFPGVEETAGTGRIHPWSIVAGPTLALLETLSHVHAAGVIHRDLKPENVLVRPDGHPIMLDFSVSLSNTPGANRLTTGGQVMGTLLYLAPEQILDRPADARTDLYAIGVMLYEALTGRIPHESDSMVSIVNMRISVPALPVRELEPSVPPVVATVVDRLLAIRPEDRFSSAAEVLAALRGAAPTPTPISSARDQFDEPALRQLFIGLDRLFHLREDAARILFERTGGNAERVELELEQWVRLGLARRDGSCFVVDRPSLNRIAAGYSGTAAERRLRELFSQGLVEEAARNALASALESAISGDLGAATTMLVEGLRMARQEDALHEEREILSLWTKIALAEATPRALDGALYEIARSRHPNQRTERLQALLRAALAAPGASGLIALEMADDLGVFTDPDLERARQRIRVVAAAARASAAMLTNVLEEIDEWAEESGEPLAELSAAEGHARRRYHEGRFPEAAALFARAAKLEPWLTGRIDATLRSASALLEAFEHENAERTADEARLLALQARHPYWEGRAEWLLRSAKYRMGKTREPDMELVEAAAQIGAADLEALVCLNEGAVAMRANMPETARALADRAALIWHEMGRPFASMLARALAMTCGSTAEDAEVEGLLQRAMTCKGPGIGLQTLGLLGRVFPEKRSSWQHAQDILVHGIPRAFWDQRMDVLSVNEALTSFSPRPVRS